MEEVSEVRLERYAESIEIFAEVPTSNNCSNNILHRSRLKSKRRRFIQEQLNMHGRKTAQLSDMLSAAEIQRYFEQLEELCAESQERSLNQKLNKIAEIIQNLFLSSR